MYETIVLGVEAYNSKWINDIAPRGNLELINATVWRGEYLKVLNSGIMIGTMHNVVHFNYLLACLIKSNPIRTVDQGFLNLFFYVVRPLSRRVILPYEALAVDYRLGPFRHAFFQDTPFLDESLDNTRGGVGGPYISNCNGEPYAILHQLDRRRSQFCAIANRVIPCAAWAPKRCGVDDAAHDIF